MLTLYIMKTQESRDLSELHTSVADLWVRLLAVGSVDEINKDEKTTDWYLILFDNETVSPDLKEAIRIIMSIDAPHDVFIFMEKYSNDKITQSPRMFRKYVKLQPNSFLPKDGGYRYERILDGWIYKND